MAGISVFLIVQRAPSDGLRKAATPMQLSIAEPSETTPSPEEAFWIAVQAG
jgi:hypothetical protein